MRALDGYKVLMLRDSLGVYEAMLNDEENNRYLLAIKEYGFCKPYQAGGRKTMLSDREAYLFETDAFGTLSAPLPEFMACLNITTPAVEASTKLTALAVKLPFLAQHTGAEVWPDIVPKNCRVPGKLVYAKQESTTIDGFSFKVLVDVVVDYDLFEWITNFPCGCINRTDFVDCGTYVLYWQDGKISALANAAKHGDLLRFTYYFR